MRQLSKLSAALFLLLCMTMHGAARLEILNIEKLFNAADAVLLVYIDGENTIRELNEDCGVRYIGSVRHRFKDMLQPVSDEFSFGRYAGLVRGGQYLLFLNYIADAAAHYETFKQQHDLPDQEPEERNSTVKMLECKGIVPGLVYHPKAAWEVKLSSVIINGIRPQMPDSIGVSSAGELEWMINKDDLFSYLRRLGSKRY